jgi:hypothetical protein
MPDELAPPRKSVELEDPGAKELGMFLCSLFEVISNLSSSRVK